ncbi:MAG: cobalamin biosynthesis protein CobW [Rhodospirillales bacterium]|nr:cobalamin biosynthesis protein CobW [Rhodospirillales bacterium]
MPGLNKVPCTIVTGFLGAGKSTLVRHALQNAGGRRLAVIVNEFGDVGVDGEMLRGCGIENCPEDAIVELPNGCLCCTVAEDFVPALETLLGNPNRRPDHILIETSGLALPKPLVKAFNWPAIRSRVTVDGVVTVVDGSAVAAGRFVDDPQAMAAQRAADPSLDHDNPLEEVYEDQLLCADLIVLNKTDLVTAEESARVEREIAAVIPRAVKVVRTVSGALDPTVLMGLAVGAEDDLDSRPSHHDAQGGHNHDDFVHFLVAIDPVATPDPLMAGLARTAIRHDVLRIKGFVEVAGRPLRLLIQGVGTRFQHQYDRPWRPGEARSGRIVVIARTGVDADLIATEIRGAALAAAA